MRTHRTATTTYVLEHDHEATTCQHADLADEILTYGAGWQRYEATPLTADGYRHQPVIELLWYEDAGRAGLASGGDAVWTDAQSPEDALERYLGIDGKEISN